MSNDHTAYPKEADQHNSRFKIKHVVIVFMLSLLITIVGAYFKVQSWSAGGMLITLGLILMSLSFVLLAIKLVTIIDIKSLLNQ